MSARLVATLLLAGLAASRATAVPPPPGPAAAAPASAWVEACTDWDEWDKAGPPYRIFGNTYYVGTCGIAAILIAGETGHILIDGGSRGGAPLVSTNIAKLGFRPSDVKILLHSHEHFDHVGGLAGLQRITGARLLASQAAAPVLRSGETASDDPQYGMHDPFAPARVDGLVTPGEPLTLGTLSLIPIATPGHTTGALSWTWTSCEGADCRAMVYADSLSPVSAENYRFSDHPEWITAYHAGLARLREVSCDILMTPHPSASGMRARLVGEPAMTCAAYADAIHARLDERLEQERAAR
ncbi:subclass B3 metallo-beta-lactamase [Novosphingobium sp. PC22D]|uniref:subclass B3 metallo-beta-lactamase n=1 Tax=Novosphingobium sp. PC22D TaxID=1962403 RepID=UPI000BF20F02|nr:subclass B3 metallo-beta-lactamase [Novosphingobium sp. PC22D]PEQ11781.1 subclass B3 metallo-beta-lactamase [Novosphingobium sp. PC22D]